MSSAGESHRRDHPQSLLLDGVERWCIVLSRRIGILAIGGMLALAILTVVDIALRYFLSMPVRGLVEISSLLMAVIVVATFPVGIMERSHITIDLLQGMLGPRQVKLGELIGALMMLVFLALVAWRLGVHAHRVGLRADATMIIGIPTAPFWWVATAILGLCVPMQVIVIAKYWSEVWAAPASPEDRRGRAIIGAVVALTLLLYAALIAGSTMGATTLALVALGALWLPLMILVPVGPAMGIVGIVGTAVLTNTEASLSTLAIQIVSFLANANVSVLPLFLMMGSLAAAAGLSDDIYAIAHALLGRLRGGLAMATIGGCAGFGAVTGSSVATVATIGRVGLPEMKARGYSTALATGTIAAGGTLGALVPPSAPLIVFALLTEASIGQLFIAAVGPAALAVALYLVTIWCYVRLCPDAAPGAARREPGALAAALKRCGALAFTFGTVLGGIYIGVFTITESAAVGVAATFLVALHRGKLKRGRFLNLIAETTITTAIIYLIIVGALIFSYFMGLSGLAEAVTKAVAALDWSPFAIVALLLAIYIGLGTFMESYTIMIITVPIVSPLILAMDYNILWWGILMLCVVETGAITPPFGLNMFVAKNLAGVPMADVFRGVMPFVAADLVRIAIVAAFPPLSLWLVSTMFN
ncbi:MAG: TRAP transporter large permease subunit [Burkholderiales bacterium]|nr:TRAP transporter large permease subunit [Burkholderiales bacterium]